MAVKGIQAVVISPTRQVATPCCHIVQYNWWFINLSFVKCSFDCEIVVHLGFAVGHPDERKGEPPNSAAMIYRVELPTQYRNFFY